MKFFIFLFLLPKGMTLSSDADTLWYEKIKKSESYETYDKCVGALRRTGFDVDREYMFADHEMRYGFFRCREER